MNESDEKLEALYELKRLGFLFVRAPGSQEIIGVIKPKHGKTGLKAWGIIDKFRFLVFKSEHTVNTKETT